MPCLAVDFEWRHFLAGKVTAESTHDWLIFRDSSVKIWWSLLCTSLRGDGTMKSSTKHSDLLFARRP